MLGDEIGKGAYGRVYKDLDLEKGDFVAIKQVSLENIAQEDLNIITNLNHKNIVKYLGSSKTKSHLHIILEYVENGSLANIIKPNKFGPFPESLVAVYIAQVLEGLVYLHEQGVIHMDIKGANILTTKEFCILVSPYKDIHFWASRKRIATPRRAMQARPKVAIIRQKSSIRPETIASPGRPPPAHPKLAFAT
ncbi:hypothetical protein QYF36_011715 [Acer negundo]|nr:hypothetical protein QYF36_011715 [Acer negundo]